MATTTITLRRTPVLRELVESKVRSALEALIEAGAKSPRVPFSPETIRKKAAPRPRPNKRRHAQ